MNIIPIFALTRQAAHKGVTSPWWLGKITDDMSLRASLWAVRPLNLFYRFTSAAVNWVGRRIPEAWWVRHYSTNRFQRLMLFMEFPFGELRPFFVPEPPADRQKAH